MTTYEQFMITMQAVNKYVEQQEEASRLHMERGLTDQLSHALLQEAAMNIMKDTSTTNPIITIEDSSCCMRLTMEPSMKCSCH